MESFGFEGGREGRVDAHRSCTDRQDREGGVEKSSLMPSSSKLSGAVVIQLNSAQVFVNSMDEVSLQILQFEWNAPLSREASREVHFTKGKIHE